MSSQYVPIGFGRLMALDLATSPARVEYKLRWPFWLVQLVVVNLRGAPCGLASRAVLLFFCVGLRFLHG